MHPQKPPRTDSSVMKPQAPRHLSRSTRPAAIGHPAAPYRRLRAGSELAGMSRWSTQITHSRAPPPVTMRLDRHLGSLTRRAAAWAAVGGRSPWGCLRLTEFRAPEHADGRPGQACRARRQECGTRARALDDHAAERV